MNPSERIREIWAEMKALNQYRTGLAPQDMLVQERHQQLEDKYESIDILFGHESTLLKAIIYYLDETE